MFEDQHTPPPRYARPPLYESLAEERDVGVAMRDGVTLCADVYRPQTGERLPALVSLAAHNKEFNAPEFVRAANNAQPAWSRMWMGAAEAGDSQYLASRGYVHVVANARGSGKSGSGGSSRWDVYDLVEWAAVQPWCDGQVGMLGLSAFAAAQFDAAALNAPHLKAIFPYGAHPWHRFRDLYPGGVLHPFLCLLDALSVVHQQRGAPGALSPEREAKWCEAMRNPDFVMYPNIYNILTMKGQVFPALFDALIDPFETEETMLAAAGNLAAIRVPIYLGASFSAYTYKRHLLGMLHAFRAIDAPKKLMLSGPAQPERPFHAFHDEMLRWFDHWMKDVDTGVMQEPAVKVWVTGANRWRNADDWPPRNTQWTKLYLHSWGRLRGEPFEERSRQDSPEPDGFLQMPPTRTDEIQKLRYLSEPLSGDLLVMGPIALTFHAAIDAADTNWIVILKDVGPDNSIRTARDGEMRVPHDLREREITRGWLKASYRAVDAARSEPGRPFHPLTRESWQPVAPGEINEYAVELMPAANLFRSGHRICIEITSLDLPSGPAGAANVEYIPYHLCSSQIVSHRIYRDARHPSHLLLPVVDAGG